MYMKSLAIKQTGLCDSVTVVHQARLNDMWRRQQAEQNGRGDESQQVQVLLVKKVN